jgi:uncharacterized membrane protein YqgA involved in biofilm formation
MYGLGTIINTGAIIVGGILGILFGKLIKERHRDTLCKTCGVAVLVIGLAGALKGMFSVGENGSISSGGDLLIVGCLALGALLGEIINIEGGFERFGAWLKKKTGNAKDNSFIEGFVSASFTVCIGAMAIVGSINDGIYGDYTILLTKSILDFIIIMVMAASLGKGTGTQFKMTVVWEANYGDLHICVDGVKVATFEDYKYISGTDYGMFAGSPGVISINFCRQVASGQQFKVTMSNLKVTQY